MSPTASSLPIGRTRCFGRNVRAALAVAAALAGHWIAPGAANAQARVDGRYFPLDQTVPPGVAGRWVGMGRPCPALSRQIVRVELPGQGGLVSFYTGTDGAHSTFPAPAAAGLRVGFVYRLKLSDMPDFPGVALYPTVELLDRLHPPPGRELDFPVPVSFSEEEIHAVLEGRLVSKVVYLEQPDRARALPGPAAVRTQRADPRDNALALADQAGRPMAIVRLGARTPGLDVPEPGFFGVGAPVQFFETAVAEEPRP